jgi:hypothetical protein
MERMSIPSLRAALALPALALPCLAASCGGNVVLDPAGAGGAGGLSSSGTTIPTGTGPGPTTVTGTSTSVTTTATTGTTGTGTMTSTSSGVTCAGEPPLTGPCKPQSACVQSNSTCLSVVNQPGSSSFGMRVAHLSLTQPAALTKGLVKQVIASSVTPNHPSCNLQGSGSFSWLLRLDLGGAIVTGGAKPVPDPTFPYTFVSETISTGLASFNVTPNKAPVSFAGCNFKSEPLDVVLPLYLDQTGSQALLWPLRQLQFFNGTFSADHNCIGRYNASGLSPANACLPDDTHPDFIDGASFSAFFVLEEADTVVISPLQQTLCVLLSGDASTFGDGAQPSRCKRNAQKQIIFKGDWCSMGNQPATPGCADSLRFAGSFAASGVKIQ